MKPVAFQVNGIFVDLIDDQENFCNLRKFLSVLQQRTYILKKIFNDGEIDKLQYSNVLEAAHAFYKESLRCY